MDKNRPKIHRTNYVKTYNSEIEYDVWKHEDSEIHAGEDSQVRVFNANQFKWTHLNLEKGQLNRRYLTESIGTLKYQAFYDTYRQYQVDTFLLITSKVPDANQKSFQFFGDIALGMWFDNFLGMKNSWVKQRFGVYTRYFASLNTIEGVDKFTSNSLDLYYRFTPGLYEVDETWGLKFDVQSVKVADLKANIAGMGIFWSEPLPWFWRMLLEWLPIFRYPKWMQVEFTYEPLALSKVKMLPSYTFLFSGRVFYRPNIYLQAGIGIHKLGFSDTTQADYESVDFNSNMNFGNIGFGMKF